MTNNRDRLKKKRTKVNSVTKIAIVQQLKYKLSKKKKELEKE